jgi:putative thioredoxin
VIEASRTQPVLVDFWAPWCAPCRALGPILEKLAAEFSGVFVLAKVDTDKDPELGARFGIRGIPNVKAFLDGKPVAEFSGALPESAVRAFITKVLPTPAAKLRLEAHRALREGDFEAAEARLREALALQPSDHSLRVDLAEQLVARQAYSEADLEMKLIPERERDPHADELVKRIELWRKAQSLPSAAELQTRLQKAPQDHELRLQLAERHIADGAHESALEQLLEVVKNDRAALRSRARELMVQVFALAGAQAEFVARYRRLLASALY